MLAKCQLLLRFGCIVMNNKDLPLRNCILTKVYLQIIIYKCEAFYGREV